jgi:hypothetical protein
MTVYCSYIVFCNISYRFYIQILKFQITVFSFPMLPTRELVAAIRSLYITQNRII